MTLKLIYDSAPDSKTLIIAPRVLHDIQLSIHQLECRFHPTRHELRELEKLRSMLKLLTEGRGDA